MSQVRAAAGVAAEFLFTLAALCGLFVSWQLVTDSLAGSAGDRAGKALAAEFAEHSPPVSAIPSNEPENTLIVEARPLGTEVFGNIVIPRFGADYVRNLAGGVTRSGTLDRGRFGLYGISAMPGEAGNFAVAAHRTTFGGPLRHIDALRAGDPVIVELRSGWYLYRVTGSEVVTPESVHVLVDVPPGGEPGGSFIVLTTCHPLFSAAERYVAYGVLEAFHPRSLGAPAWLPGGGQ